MPHRNRCQNMSNLFLEDLPGKFLIGRNYISNSELVLLFKAGMMNVLDVGVEMLHCGASMALMLFNVIVCGLRTYGEKRIMLKPMNTSHLTFFSICYDVHLWNGCCSCTCTCPVVGCLSHGFNTYQWLTRCGRTCSGEQMRPEGSADRLVHEEARLCNSYAVNPPLKALRLSRWSLNIAVHVEHFPTLVLTGGFFTNWINHSYQK